MSYPDVCMYRTRCLWKAFRAIEAALVKYDNNMKRLFLVVDSVTLTANHSNYLVCDRANAVCHCQESGKTAINCCNALVIN